MRPKVQIEVRRNAVNGLYTVWMVRNTTEFKLARIYTSSGKLSYASEFCPLFELITGIKLPVAEKKVFYLIEKKKLRTTK